MLRNLLDKGLKYIEVKLDIVKLSVIERTSLIMGYTMFMGFLMIAGGSVVIFLGVALSMYLADVLDNAALGFLITSGVFVLILIGFVLMRRKIITKLADIFIDLFTNDIEEDYGEKEDEQ
ncbi:MAG: hypothetical protein H6551_00810 [Chitinophagales bacterium]|nr:hypothetical protein [Chitinophagaceae bacterium]MCB9063663.1 hypothetical protein [Chitinophagales bacterium]